MNESTGLKLKDDTRLVRVLLAAAVAPSYIYYSFATTKSPYSAIPAVFALILILSQYLRSETPSHSWKEFITPVAGCLLNASVIFTTGFQGSPFLYVVLIPLLTYSTERDAVWVFRSVMFNTVTMVLLILRSLVHTDWFGLLNVLGITGISHVACYHIKRSKWSLASVVASILQEGRKDPLTCLYNRRALEEKVLRLIAAQLPFALVMCDVDHFKWYNDRYGHLDGDRVLQRIAHTLMRSVSPRGMAFRWGGDEFVLVLPTADRSTVESVRSRIRQFIESQVKELGMSFGVAMFPADGDSLEDLLNIADRMLYRAKEKLS